MVWEEMIVALTGAGVGSDGMISGQTQNLLRR